MGKVIYEIENKTNKYFIDNYIPVMSNIEFLDKQTLAIDDENNICRFCGRTNKEVKFSNKCHAIPEFLGNKAIITKNECNECNHKYADLLEDSLSKLTLPTRNITRVYGKKGVPKYEEKKTNSVCEYKEGTYQITNNDEFVELDEENKKLILKFQVQTMIPLKAYKALVRIALNCLPKVFFDKFKMIEWLESEEDLGGATEFYTKVITRFIPKISPMFGIAVFIRKNNKLNVPYCQMVLQSNNTFYQVIIPFIEEDRYLEKCESVIIEPFSFGVKEGEQGKISIIDLSANEKKSTIQTCIINYERKEPMDNDNKKDENDE